MRERQLFQLTLMRIREFLREPEAVFWTFFFPILMALALGVAFRSKGPAPVYVGVLQGPTAERIVSQLKAAHIDASVLSEEDARMALRKGKVAVVVEPGANGYTYRYDPSRPDSRVARLSADNALQDAAGRTSMYATSDDPISEKGSRYIDFLIPGLIGLNLMSSGLWGVGYTVVKMRNEKLLKRLMSTPISRTNFLLSFVLGRLVFLAVELALVLGFAWIAFGVPVRGSLLTLLAVSTLAACSFTSLGLLTASRSSSIESVQGYMNAVQVPMWILSGVFFSSDNFPDMAQPFIRALPLTAVNDALRAIMLDGAGVVELAPKIAVITIWGILCLVAALRLFRWR